MKKRLLFVFLSALISHVAWAYDVVVNGVRYKLDSENYTAAVVSAYSSSSVTISDIVAYNETVYDVTSIADNAFVYCSGLTSISLPNSILSIGTRAFQYCSGLTSINLPDNLQVIGLNAFQGCTKLTTVEIPASVSVIAGSAFSDCTKLQSFTVENGSPYFRVYNNGRPGLYSKDMKTLVAVPCAVTGAFEIPNIVTTIGGGAFDGCKGITSISVPSSVRSIGEFVFANCEGLTSLFIPSAVDSIGKGAFSGCFNLQNFSVDAENAYFKTDGVSLFSKDGKELVAYVVQKGKTKYTVPNSVVTIGDYAFFDSEQLEKISIPNSVATIGEWAFGYCPSLPALQLPNRITSLPRSVFYGNAFTSLTIPKSVTRVDRLFLYGLLDLETLIFEGTTPPTIDSDSFSTPDGLTTIYVPSGAAAAFNVAPWKNYTIKEYNVPTPGKYYILRPNRGTYGYWALCEDKHAMAQGTPQWKTPSTLKFSDLNYVWKLEPSAGKVKIKNQLSQQYLTADPALYKNFTVTNEGSAFSLTKSGSDKYYILNESALVPSYPCLHVDTYGSVVRWEDDYSDSNGVQWFFEEVPAATVEQLLSGQKLNIELSQLLNKVHRTLFEPMSLTISFSNHGLLTSASQLSTNKQETIEGPIASLLDSDLSTFFHSTWSTQNTNNAYHHLQVDLGKDVTSIDMKYAERLTTNGGSPTKIRVYGWTGSAWREVCTTTLTYGRISLQNKERWVCGLHTIVLDQAYRHVRFVVEETKTNNMNNGNLYFYLSELGIWETGKKITGISSALRNEVHSAYVTAYNELQAGAATQATINRLKKLFNDNFSTERVDLVDAETFANGYEREVERIAYTRNFQNTNWQAWYLPVAVNYDKISDNFVVARLNDVHQFDDNNDGKLDRTALEIETLDDGDVIQANLPYMIRAKQAGSHTFVFTNAVLNTAEINSMSCSSMKMDYTFTGNYKPLSGAVMVANGYYGMGGGVLVTPAADDVLSPYRWYLSMNARSGYASSYAPKRIYVIEKDDSGATGIDHAVMDNQESISWPADVYDMKGQLVKKQAYDLETLPKGIYLVNGNKVIK